MDAGQSGINQHKEQDHPPIFSSQKPYFRVFNGLLNTTEENLTTITHLTKKRWAFSSKSLTTSASVSDFSEYLRWLYSNVSFHCQYILPEQLCQTHGNKAGERGGGRDGTAHQPDGTQRNGNGTYVELQRLTTRGSAKEKLCFSDILELFEIQVYLQNRSGPSKHKLQETMFKSFLLPWHSWQMQHWMILSLYKLIITISTPLLVTKSTL